MTPDRFENLRDGGAEFPPGVGFRLELGAAFRGELVVLRTPVVVGRAPARLDPAAPLEPVERRVERSLLDLQRGAGDLMEPLGDRPAVLRLERDRLENEEVEGALRKF